MRIARGEKRKFTKVIMLIAQYSESSVRKRGKGEPSFHIYLHLQDGCQQKDLIT